MNDAVIQFRLQSKEKSGWEAKAKEAGMKLSEWVRWKCAQSPGVSAGFDQHGNIVTSDDEAVCPPEP